MATVKRGEKLPYNVLHNLQVIGKIRFFYLFDFFPLIFSGKTLASTGQLG
jgi:hypothetical protein